MYCETAAKFLAFQEMKPFSELLKKLREDAHLTQQELAVAADMSVSMVSKAEAGKHHPEVGTMKKLAAALSVDVQRLIDEAKKQKWPGGLTATMKRGGGAVDSPTPQKRQPQPSLESHAVRGRGKAK